MPRKWSDASHAGKLFALFRKLLFTEDRYSLTELSRELNCSKQTIRNLVDSIEKIYGMRIEQIQEGQRLYFCGKKLVKIPVAQELSQSEIQVMQMCRVFAEHLLGKNFVQQAQKGLLKSAQLLPGTGLPSEKPIASFQYGTIDYTPFQDTISVILSALRLLQVCKITYRARSSGREKTYYIKPLKLFSHQNSLYLHARLAKAPGKVYKNPRFDPLIAVHRIKHIEPTDRVFEFPRDYDFDRVFAKTFGVIKGESFKAVVRFTGWAREFVRERLWSADQKIKQTDDSAIELTVTASSESEVVSWVLSFGRHARVVKPEWLVEKLTTEALNIRNLYAAN